MTVIVTLLFILSFSLSVNFALSVSLPFQCRNWYYALGEKSDGSGQRCGESRICPIVRAVKAVTSNRSRTPPPVSRLSSLLPITPPSWCTLPHHPPLPLSPSILHPHHTPSLSSSPLSPSPPPLFPQHLSISITLPPSLSPSPLHLHRPPATPIIPPITPPPSTHSPLLTYDSTCSCRAQPLRRRP